MQSWCARCRDATWRSFLAWGTWTWLREYNKSIWCSAVRYTPRAMNGGYPRAPVRKLKCAEQRGWDMFVELLGKVHPQAIGTITSNGQIYWIGPETNAIATTHKCKNLVWSHLSDTHALEKGLLIKRAGTKAQPHHNPSEFTLARQPISHVFNLLSFHHITNLPIIIIWK